MVYIQDMSLGKINFKKIFKTGFKIISGHDGNTTVKEHTYRVPNNKLDRVAVNRNRKAMDIGESYCRLLLWQAGDEAGIFILLE
jgi:hypothetical protein